ncbi:MAG: helix-turn-helix domain-containing protein [Gammaproteobacteria bacterium]
MSAEITERSTPGKIIEHAREQAKLSQADLAQRLRLDTKYIRHLELDNFEQLPGPTFVKGYLRSIANELNIAPEPILEAYRQTSKTDREPTLADFESRPPAQISSNSFVVKAGSYAVAITLVVLIVFWWQSNDSSKKATDLSPHAEAESHTATPLPYEFNQVIHDDDAFFHSPLAKLNTSDSALPAAEGVDEPSPVEISGLAKFQLSLSTTAESWVEIYDIDGKQLYFGMANTRTPVTINSNKPLDLLIGNTPTVELNINQNPIDLAPLSDDGVAKFKYPPTQ